MINVGHKLFMLDEILPPLKANGKIFWFNPQSFPAVNSISPNETKTKKAKLPKIKKENNVLLLKKSNFDRALKETKYLLVEFYVSLSQLSQNLSEEFAEAARQLKKEAPRIQFGKIDVTDQHDLRKEFNIQQFPTVKFFVDGSRKDPIDCKGVREASTFITWVKRRTGPSTVLINSTAQAEDMINAEDLAVIGFFKSRTDVASFVSQTSVKIFDVPVESHILLFAPKNSQTFNATYENYKSAAVEFRGKIMFVLVDTNETRNGRVFEYFRITQADVPAVRILNLTRDAKYKMPADEVTVENLRHFCQSYLDGKAKLHLSSEEIPDDWDKLPVKVLVGKNFNRIVFNETMTVFVMFYAPWSDDCTKLLPVWDKLGEEYESRKDIIIAKIDVTANDILSITLDRYPFFRLFPAGPDYQVVAYAGEHTVKAFSEFLEEQSKTKAETREKQEETGGTKEDLSQEENVITQKAEL
ncbi:protein disulfide-isomerase-like protein of the testis [Apteryx mantelli]|uniref:Protein disulfide-isomerase-like protein of the testis n=1 Tax=Apteryx mantelli TaxID=2696672 RepID=A0ABM4FCG7_9AVES